MTIGIPSAAEVQATLKPMNYAALAELARRSGVPFHTLLKIRDGQTEDPRISTVYQFWPHVAAVAAEAA